MESFIKCYKVAQTETDKDWIQLRGKCAFTASEAGALFGFSSNPSQRALIEQKRTGIKPKQSDILKQILEQGKEDEIWANNKFVQVFNQFNKQTFSTVNGWFWTNQLKLDKDCTLQIGASPDRFLVPIRSFIPSACIEYKTCQKIAYKDYLPESTEIEMSWVLQNLIQQFCTGIYLGYIFYYNRNTDGCVLWSFDLQGGDFDRVWDQITPEIRRIWSYVEHPEDRPPNVTAKQKASISAILNPFITCLYRDAGRPPEEKEDSESQEGQSQG